ncbi:GNAT family N-acetyltransferase [Lentibacter algarum]|uniref:GNAT family N-acetyltransferase n=1 Tax=Lentibacter algarum TaxID=576131 RepID=UPI001C07815F|nr:GNAT family N-acetyltransferase [Lentibacter algarum]MBU2981494.1 GNAT family N-acetyltransferase [Lentibacter algarum]
MTNHKRRATDLTIRRLHANDKSIICDHLQRLDAPSRRARFCGAISDGGVSRYVQSINCSDSIVCGAFVNGELRGIAELHETSPNCATKTEAAFSVEADWQNIGIGDALFERVVAMARNRSVRTIQIVCLKENLRMKHLAAKREARFLRNHEVVEATLHPRRPTPMSLAQEIIREMSGVLHRMHAQ